MHKKILERSMQGTRNTDIDLLACPSVLTDWRRLHCRVAIGDSWRNTNSRRRAVTNAKLKDWRWVDNVFSDYNYLAFWVTQILLWWQPRFTQSHVYLCAIQMYTQILVIARNQGYNYQPTWVQERGIIIILKGAIRCKAVSMQSIVIQSIANRVIQFQSIVSSKSLAEATLAQIFRNVNERRSEIGGAQGEHI